MQSVFGLDYLWDKEVIEETVSEKETYNYPERFQIDDQQWSMWGERFSSQEVKKVLWDLVENPKQNLNGYVLLYQKQSVAKGGHDQLFWVDPICAALVLEEYECAEQLLEIGYGVNQTKEEPKYLLRKKDYGITKADVSLSQFLFVSNTPPDLYKRIWEKMVLKERKSIRKYYDVEKDYIDNPFLQKEKSWEELIDLIERAHKIVPKACQGMFNRAGACSGNPSIALDMTAVGIILRFLQIFQTEVAVKQILDGISMYFWYSEKKHRWLSVVIKVNESCTGIACLRKCLINNLFDWLLLCIEDKILYRELGKCEKQTIQVLKKLCTKEYTQEDFMKYMSIGFDNIYYTGWRWDLFAVWRQEMNRELHPHRTSTYLQTFLNLAIGRASTSLDKSLNELMVLLEALSGISDAGSSQREIIEEVRIVMEDIVKLGSEEVLILCWKKGIVTREALPMVTEMAMETGKKQLIPLLIYLGASLKEKNACP